MGHQRDYSDSVAQAVDTEVRNFIDRAHTEAWTVLMDNRAILDRLATELLEKETLDHHQLATIFEGVKQLPERPLWLSSGDRPPSKKGPVSVPRRKAAAAPKKPAAKKPVAKKTTTKKPAVKKPATPKAAAKKTPPSSTGRTRG
jgi:cell division protease FtsH